MEYQIYQLEKEKKFEATCLRCGNCCGAQDDPCMHLVIQPHGEYFCDIYDSRGGVQKTRSGKFFECVSIRDILHEDWSGNWNCAYKKQNNIIT
ncbi:MAG: hypothetical protein KJ915_09640 [Candidatus Omnitrophica bacterium]|nr:hypothetical protein [Candidatus Omnitrophota bacterium]